MKNVNIAGQNIVLVTTRTGKAFQTLAWTVIANRTVTLGTAPSAVYPKARLEAEVIAAVREAGKPARKARMIYEAPVRQPEAATPATPVTTAHGPAPRLAGYKTQRLPEGPKAKALEVHVTTDADCPKADVIAEFVRAAEAVGYTFQAPAEAELFGRRKSGALRWIVKGKVSLPAQTA